MPITKKELLRRDATRSIGAELLESIRSLNRGEVGRIYVIQLRTGGRRKLLPNETASADCQEKDRSAD